MLAAVLAIVCALVPDPVTVARAPSAYVPLDSALFTPITVAPSGSLAASGSTIAPVLDGPFTLDPVATALAAPRAGASPAVRSSGGHLGQQGVAWRTTEVSWYGPGAYGQRTACGEALTPTLVGVAHRTLPCGTLVAFRWNGRTVIAPVVDRGPYVDGRLWDLTAGLCALLDHCYTGPITWKVT